MTDTAVFNMDTFREARLAICAAWAGYIADDLDVEVENRWPDSYRRLTAPLHDNYDNARRDMQDAFPDLDWRRLAILEHRYLQEERGWILPSHEVVLASLPTDRWVTTTEAAQRAAGKSALRDSANVRNRLYALQRWGLIRCDNGRPMRWQAIAGKRIQDGFFHPVAVAS